MHLSLSDTDFDIFESTILETHERVPGSNYLRPKDSQLIPQENYEMLIFQTTSKEGEPPIYRIRPVSQKPVDAAVQASNGRRISI